MKIAKRLVNEIKINNWRIIPCACVYSALPIYPPVTEQLPAPWWDSEFDKSLLIGTWKHGYENYTAMRQDSTLCFLSRCGPPSDKEIQMHANPATPNQNQ